MRWLLSPRECGGLGLWRCLAWRDAKGLTCWQLAHEGHYSGHTDYAQELYRAWETGLRRELTAREATRLMLPPTLSVLWLGA